MPEILNDTQEEQVVKSKLDFLDYIHEYYPMFMGLGRELVVALHVIKHQQKVINQLLSEKVNHG